MVMYMQKLQFWERISVVKILILVCNVTANEWTNKKLTKPGSFLRVLWKKDRATRANFAWWDSEDGLHGGKMLRCAVLESDRQAIKEFDLFPSGDMSSQVINIVTASDQTFEMQYVIYSFLSADEIGPPGMVFVAPQGVQFPIDAVWIKPSIMKQLERKKVSFNTCEQLHRKLMKIHLPNGLKGFGEYA